MIRFIKKAINFALFYIYNRIIALATSIKKDTIIFCTETSEVLVGNLKCIYDYLKDQQYNLKIHTKRDRRDNRTLKEMFSLWKDLSTAKYILIDDFYELTAAMKVRKEQELIQLWHGPGAFKKFGFSRIGTGDEIKNVRYRDYTKVITSSESIRWCYAEAFNIDIDKVKATGIPRTDMFFNEELKNKIKKCFFEKYPELDNKKIVLFAPTFRGKTVEEAYYDFDYANVDALQNELGNDYAIIVKWHPALKRNIEKGILQSFQSKNIYDFTEWDDINQLLIVTDILITDYSSVIFDYYFLNKPIIYFVYDLEKYEAGRGLYYDFDQYVYGDVVLDRRLLAQSIKAENQWEEKRKAFGDRFLSACDGQSTKKTAEYIFEGSNMLTEDKI